MSAVQLYINLVILGYIHNIQNLISVFIPHDIILLIKSFCTSSQLYGIGYNLYDELGFIQKHVIQFTKLKNIENIINLCDADYIYPQYQGLIIKGVNGKLYSSGNNNNQDWTELASKNQKDQKDKKRFDEF